MKKWLSALAVSAVLLAGTALAGPREAEWKKVDEAIGKGLPKTAIEELLPIIEASMREKTYPETIKAIGLRISLEGNIQGNKPEEKIFRMQSEVEKAPPAMKAPMEAVLAHWYWQYFQHNRWRFIQRTQTAEAPGPDLQTWDLPRILKEIEKHFTTALTDEKTLKETPVSAWDGLIEKGNMSDAYRPTMFDFLAHEALQFYCTGEQGAAAAEDEFVLTASSPVFDDAQKYLTWWRTFAAKDFPDSPTVKALDLYGRLLAFHENDKDETAFIDADLWRLNFGDNKAVGEEKSDRYIAALQRFADKWSQHEVSARALAYWATQLNEEGDPVEAHRIAEQGFKAFPRSPGGAMCYNLLKQIESRSASIQTESVWVDPLPTINVTYRNVTRVYFRAVPADFASHIKAQRWGMFNYDDKQRKSLLGRRAALAWDAELPATSDYRERTEKLPAPRQLAPGFYFIIASHERSFSEDGNPISIAPVWVSDLALVLRQRNNQGIVEGFVLQARTGEPLAGASVRAWVRDREGWFKPGEQIDTDENGLFRFTKRPENSFIVAAEHHGQQVASGGERWVGSSSPEEPDHRTVFFTDRSLYRPGQTIYYKGIHLRYNTGENKYGAIAGEDVTIEFLDPNGKEIARATHRCNDYGSFDGAFTAPRDRVMGRMSIVHRYKGQASLNVEEYKRPKFQVELAKPKEAAKLNAEVVVSGKATAYTGAAIGDAKVKWRVMREVRWPVWWRWCCWFWPPQPGGNQAIAHGSAVTGADGAFEVRFVARPDPSVSEKDEPSFEFVVYADVTDSTGETRSDEQSVRAGFTALQAELSANDWQTPDMPVEITVATKSLDGEPQAASGTVKVYRLKEPAAVVRADLQPAYPRWYGRRAKVRPAPQPNPADPNSWELADIAGKESFKTDEKGEQKLRFKLRCGIYRAMLETTDRFGKTVTARLPLTVVDPRGKALGLTLANYFASPAWKIEPGQTFQALWGTGYPQGRAFVEVEHRGKPLRAWWTGADRTQEVFDQPVTEELRGGFTVRVTYVRENRGYFNERIVNVPWSNKELAVKWERFRSKLTPGQKETWTALVTGPDSGKAVAEMVAAMYDASLDQYLPHDWARGFGVFRQERDYVNTSLENTALPFQHIAGWWSVDSKGVSLTYRFFPPNIVANLWGYGYYGNRNRMLRKDSVEGDVMTLACAAEAPRPTAAPMEAAANGVALAKSLAFGGALREESKAVEKREQAAEPPKGPDLSKVAARKNLNETAFFFPHLVSGADGVVKMEFTMPEALTEWKFLGFAHDADLRAGYLTGKTVTAKDLMVEPNPPRFVREGDEIEFTVKVSNQSADRQAGKVRLTFADARTLRDVSSDLGLRTSDLAFDIPSKESRSFSWRIAIPDGCEFLTYKAVGSTGELSDGEEGNLPVLSRRILVQESLPLPIRGKQTKQFEFTKLLQSGKSDTLQHQSLTVQMVSQPAWYAVMALPYLMEYPYECSEQTFNRLYANALARHIANSDPKIRRIFDLWKGTPALDSPLEKNQDLKSVMLEETPWLRQAQAESQARRNVGILFDGNRLDEETAGTLRKLTEMQISDGLWPWFPGGRPSEYISLYIVTGFGRLRHLGVDIEVSSAVKALSALDQWVDEQYREILKHGNKDENHLNPTIAFYLYGRSFFLKDQPIAKGHQESTAYWLDQARKFWLDLGCRQSQAHLAVGLKRFGDKDTPTAIMRSMKERSVSTEELGMFWRDLELSWWWYRAPIETQAMMIEAFAEVMDDAQAMEDCKVWILKQKQTQDWKTTKATADAVYGLLLRGTNMLASDALVEVSLAGETIRPEKVEAGTGFYEQKFTRAEIKPAMGEIVVKKVDEGVSWGSVHWQYLEDMTKVTPYEGTPLKLKKTLFVKETTKKGQELRPVKGALQVGDELVVRIELRTDRDMEYVHLKDQRGSGTEPVNVLSRYKYQDGLAYYESTRDTASHFFIDYLPKGVYVFEYSTRIQHRGKYQTGVAAIECMYAPEFNSHSESFALEVK